IGHLITLAEPDKYDDRYKKWNIGDLPIIPERFKLLPVFRTKDQLKVISDLSKQCDRIVNACDAGREGQLIFDYIRQHLKLVQPVKRLWISDLTPETIRRGFVELKNGSEYDNLTKAARARSEADWLVGMNGSRAFTTRHNTLLSVGRVQTPVLALIYDRQKQIEAFASAKFYEVQGFFRQENTLYRGLWQGERITDAKKADELAAKVHDKPASIASYEKKDTKEYPFKLHDLTLLQREANAKLGFSAKKTLDLAQALYEKHKVISYPRTNSNYVTEANIPEMHNSLDMLAGTDYSSLVAGANRSLVHKNNKAVCNPARVEDHHAILPTRKKPGNLAPDEKKIYDLIIHRFLSHFYPAAEYKVHTVLTEVAQETFKTTIKELVSEGWKVVYAGTDNGKTRSSDKKKTSDSASEAEQEEAEEIASPFILDAAGSVHCEEARAIAKETQPPKVYTEGTLLKAMESAGKQVEDDELREAMKDSGLGTPATRAATIERLKFVGYVEMQGKRIMVTQKGRMAIELIRAAGVDLLTSPEMTGHWERRLHEISRGQASDTAFMDKVKQFATLIVEKVRGQAPAARDAFGEAAESGRGGNRARGGAAGRRSSAAGAAGRKPSAVGTAERKPSVAEPGTVIGMCPRQGCGGRIFLGRKGYGCSNYKTGCGFVIWKDSLGKMLTDSMARSLIEKGKTSKLKFKDKNDQPFEARIVLKDASTGALELDSN
ncbi:MAG: DNA topoisomerase 3, partial [Gorillibacterium sp.]|nr:DNA topoisomerase 3 [Gorillibacterium sp.]